MTRRDTLKLGVTAALSHHTFSQTMPNHPTSDICFMRAVDLSNTVPVSGRNRAPMSPITDWLPVHPHVEQGSIRNRGIRIRGCGWELPGDGGKPAWIKLTDDDDVYIPRFGWIREDWAWAEVLNRRQDVMELYLINTKSGKSRKVLREVESDAWVDVNDDFRVLKSGDRFLCTSWQDEHTHIYLYSFDKNDPLAADAKMERQLESGDYEVLEVNAVDEETGTVYFTTNKDDPRQEKIFSVKLDGAGMQALSRDWLEQIGN